MDLSRTILEVIDTRTFSNLWFWIALAVMWSAASHRIVGVPWDMVLRARRRGGADQADVEALAALAVRRILQIQTLAGAWVWGIAAFLLAGCFTLGFVYGMQFSQAIFLLGFPMAIVRMIGLRTALAIAGGEGEGEALYRRLRAQRLWTQAIGMLSIFATSLWGMYQNLSASVLGG